jgi:hypothetical protein
MSEVSLSRLGASDNGQVHEPPPAAIPAESDLAACLSPARVAGQTKLPPKVTALEVRKPNGQEYIRVKPGEDLALSLFKRKNGERLYLFRAELEPLLDPRGIRSYRLVLAKSLRAITPFIWAIPVPQDDLGRTWHEAAQAAAREAETTWIKIVSDTPGRTCVTYPANGTFDEPEWPAVTFTELIALAFKNQKIDDSNHPVVRELAGEA